MFALFFESALYAASLPARQNTTLAISNMEHMYPSGLEQSYQGATYYKQPILVKKIKTRPVTNGNLV
jgi:hypothetical protein